MPTLVLSVGQCGFDDSRISRLVRETCGALLDRAFTSADAQKMIGEKQYSLILVNRVFDGDGESGVEFIADMKRNGVTAPMMLVSDYADAQRAAVEQGALPGFGKSALFAPETAELLRGVLAGNVAR